MPLTRSDRLGKWIARKLYALAIKHPGRPGLCNSARRQAADLFGRIWPWSWRAPRHPCESVLRDSRLFVRALAGFPV